MRKNDYEINRGPIERISHNSLKMIDELEGLRIIEEIKPPLFSLRNFIANTRVPAILENVFHNFSAGHALSIACTTGIESLQHLSAFYYNLTSTIYNELGLRPDSVQLHEITKRIQRMPIQNLIFSTLISIYTSLEAKERTPQTFDLFCNKLLPQWWLTIETSPHRCDYQNIAKFMILNQEAVHKMIDNPIEHMPHIFKSKNASMPHNETTLIHLKDLLWLQCLAKLCMKNDFGALHLYDALHTRSSAIIDAKKTFADLFRE